MNFNEYFNRVMMDLSEATKVGDPKLWLMLCALAVLVGAYCLRGFKAG